MNEPELEVVFTRDGFGLHSSILLHLVLPAKNCVEPGFFKLKVLAHNENQGISAFNEGPHHVISPARLVAVEEFRSPFFQLGLKNVQCVLHAINSFRWDAKIGMTSKPKKE